jgi:hypothetical protein
VISGAPWGANGVTFALHMNTPGPNILDPSSGALDIFSYLLSGQLVLELRRNRVVLAQTAGENVAGWTTNLGLDLYDGKPKTIVWSVELGLQQRLWVDGNLVISSTAPPTLAAISTGETRWFRWLDWPTTSGEGTGPGPNVKTGVNLGLNAVLVLSRPASVAEVNTIGSTLAARHGTTWSTV